VVVAESVYESVKLNLVSWDFQNLRMSRAYILVTLQNFAPGQSLRVFATSMEGPVHARIPATFEGAIFVNSKRGRIDI
jgi:hypothetical protein